MIESMSTEDRPSNKNLSSKRIVHCDLVTPSAIMFNWLANMGLLQGYLLWSVVFYSWAASGEFTWAPISTCNVPSWNCSFQRYKMESFTQISNAYRTIAWSSWWVHIDQDNSPSTRIGRMVSSENEFSLGSLSVLSCSHQGAPLVWNNGWDGANIFVLSPSDQGVSHESPHVDVKDPLLLRPRVQTKWYVDKANCM